MFIEQCIAVMPITIQLLLVLGIFFQRGPTAPLELIIGLICAIMGLILFADALRFAIMPLAEEIGQNLPRRLPTWAVFVVAFCLGVLCTYAEPALASLRPLARLVRRDRAPYLHLMLNDMQEVLILCIALGVGCAAVLGTLRFLKDWSLKPLIVACIIPTVGCACYMQWGDPDLRPLLGLAWDCGAVTTGPVTVPILLALGIGVIRSNTRRRRASQMLKHSVETSSGQQSTLDGFGIVTLASLLPILAVEVLSIVLSFTRSLNSILDEPEEVVQEDGVMDRTPVRELVFALRAVLPLSAVLVFLVRVVLRKPLPKMSVYLSHTVDGDSQPSPPPPKRKVPLIMWGDVWWDDALPVVPSASTPGLQAPTPSSPTVMALDMAPTPRRDPSGLSAAAQVPAAKSPPQSRSTSPEVQAHPRPPRGQEDGNATEELSPSPQTWGVLAGGVLMAVVGMAMFNVGLTYGFTSIGDQVGQLLPGAFMSVSSEPDSPFYSKGVGILITLGTIFVLGVLATRAEPALNVLGKTVQTLSRGTFSKKMLIYSVCMGVGSGMAMGATKVLFSVPIIYFILIKYTITMLLTAQAPESFTNIAWDSAGVTTGPVTVPFVLSTGIGFCKAADCTEGFGILTTASVGPIIMVLFVQAARCRPRPKRAAVATATKAFPAPLANQVQSGLAGGDGQVKEVEMRSH